MGSRKKVQRWVLKVFGIAIGLAWFMIWILIIPFLTGCESSDEHRPVSSGNVTHDGVAVGLAWDSVTNASIAGYYIHYGKDSPNRPGSCAYSDKRFVSSNHGTVTNLDFGVTYYFAVSAYNGLESSCSNEVFIHTIER